MNTTIEPCVICCETPSMYIDQMRDFEYGVHWRSDFVRCEVCGLVAQHPRVGPTDISRLYPKNYFVHTASAKKGGIYRILKDRLDRKKISKLAQFLPECGCLIEIGCGDGSFLRTLEKSRPDARLIGIDINDPNSFQDSKVEFKQGQLEELELESACADLLFFDDLIEHVVEPKLFLEECLRVLKPGGTVFGVTPDHESLDRKLFGKYWAGYHYPRHTFLFDHHNLATLLSHVGFESVTFRGGNGLWVKSLENLFMELPATKPRGPLHYLAMIAFYPVDLLINLFSYHGEMSFITHKPN